MSIQHLFAAVAALVAGSAFAAGGDLGQTQQQSTNWTAIAPSCAPSAPVRTCPAHPPRA